MARSKPQPSPVGDYPERPLSEALANPDDILAVENQQPDQIPDYHEKHPTLKPGKAHEVEPPHDVPGDAVE